MEPWRTWRISPWTFASLWKHEHKFIDMQLKWNIGGHHSEPVHLGDTGTHQWISNWSGTLENITPDLCTSLKTQEHINIYPIEVEHGEHHSGPVHTFGDMQTDFLIYNWSGTVENISLNLCTPLRLQEYINRYSTLENVTLNLYTPLVERQESICWYPIEVEPWRTWRISPWTFAHLWRPENIFIDTQLRWGLPLVWTCTHHQRHRNRSIDIPLQWNFAGYHFDFVYIHKQIGTHLMIHHWNRNLEDIYLKQYTPTNSLVGTHFNDVSLKLNLGGHHFRPVNTSDASSEDVETHQWMSHWSGTLHASGYARAHILVFH